MEEREWRRDWTLLGLVTGAAAPSLLLYFVVSSYQPHPPYTAALVAYLLVVAASTGAGRLVGSMLFRLQHKTKGALRFLRSLAVGAFGGAVVGAVGAVCFGLVDQISDGSSGAGRVLGEGVNGGIVGTICALNIGIWLVPAYGLLARAGRRRTWLVPVTAVAGLLVGPFSAFQGAGFLGWWVE